MTIKVLDTKVISQIAAGEVIERPASVVKELLENALDAGSTQISIEIKNGGISLIRVSDNGTGIPDEETETAFERHATSKIDNLQDLQNISSLGFRGEALPSIAAVAQVQMSTCVRGVAAGTFLSLDDGQIIRHDSQARSPGTTITVYNLFRKIPARLKFLKSEGTEGSRITDVVSQYALVFPEVRFHFISDGKTNLLSPGSGKLKDSVIAVYGNEIGQNMLEVKNPSESWDSNKNHIKIYGLVGTPKISRSSRDYISIFVNHRWINNRILTYAVEEAYHGLLMQGKHPIAIINISIPPEQVDVNVHPAKLEVKFQDERAVFGAVQKTVRQTLVQTSPVPQIEESTPRFSVPLNPLSTTQSFQDIRRSIVTPEQPAVPQITPLISLPLLRVLGQLACNYVVAEGPDGLYLIDQHAAHERIQLENIQNQRASSKIEVQGLLEPVTFEVDLRQSTALNNHLNELKEWGFNIEKFGERTYLVRAIPAILRNRDWSAVIRESLDTSSSKWSDVLLNIIACHSAIRAGQVLTDTEMRELVKQLEQTTLPNSCPHGRPTMIQITLSKLEKEFGRA